MIKYRCFYRDGYEEVFTYISGGHFIPYQEHFLEVAARHGWPVDFRKEEE